MCLKTIRDIFFPNMWSVINTWVRHKEKSWSLFLKQTRNALTEIYTFLKLEFYLKPSLKNLGIHLLKLVAVVYTLDCNVSWVYKHKNTKIGNKHKLTSLSSLPLLILPTSLLFLDKNRTGISFPFVTWRRSSYD